MATDYVVVNFNMFNNCLISLICLIPPTSGHSGLDQVCSKDKEIKTSTHDTFPGASAGASAPDLRGSGRRAAGPGDRATRTRRHARVHGLAGRGAQGARRRPSPRSAARRAATGRALPAIQRRPRHDHPLPLTVTFIS